MTEDSKPDAGAPGWHRTYWTVWSANLIAAIGMMSFLPFLPGLLEEIGVEGDARIAAWSGVIFGAAPLSAAFMGPIWGALGDRIGRRLMVVRAMFAIAIFVGAMSLVTSPQQLLLLRIGQGLFSGFIPPSITLVSLGAPAHRQGRVAGSLQTALAIGAMLGPLIGGLFAAQGRQQDVFVWVGIGAALSGLLVWFGAREDPTQRIGPEHVDGPPVRRADALRGLASSLLEDLRGVWQTPRVRRALVLLFFLQFGMGATNPLMELYVREVFPPSAESTATYRLLAALGSIAGGERAAVLALATSVLFGGMAFVNLIALPLWGRYGDRAGHTTGLFWCCVGAAVSLAIQAMAPMYGVLFAGRMLMGASLAGAGPLAFGVAAAEIDVKRRGGAFGVVFSARLLAVALGSAMGGVLAGPLGVRGLMLLASVALVGALVVLRRRASASR
ncbi:MAG: DHA1 family multidrug resistance protein-like MFS transporter [Chlamydiales bacterium]|jgi:DHA1 family multidrug resistance protein-like MFS transporter